MIKGVSGAKALLGEAGDLYKDAAGQSIQGHKVLTVFVESVRGLLGCSIDDFTPHVGRARQNFAEAQDVLVSTEGCLSEANRKVFEALGAAGVAGLSSSDLMTVGQTLVEPFTDRGVLAKLDVVASRTEALASTTIRRIHSDVEAVVEEAREILAVVPPVTDPYVQASELCQQIQGTL